MFRLSNYLTSYIVVLPLDCIGSEVPSRQMP